MSSPNRSERPARPATLLAPQPALRAAPAPRPAFILIPPPPVRAVPPKEIPQPPAAPAAEPGPIEQVIGGEVRQGVLEQVFFDGGMQLQLWWESEGRERR